MSDVTTTRPHLDAVPSPATSMHSLARADSLGGGMLGAAQASLGGPRLQRKLLQRRAQGAAVQRADTLDGGVPGPQDAGPVAGVGTPPQPGPPPAPDPVVAELALNADVETADRTKLTWKELQAAQVGHAWISLRYLDPTKVPVGLGSPTEGLLKGGGTALGFWPLIHRAAQWVPGSAGHQAIKDRQAQGQTPGGGASADKAHTGFSMDPTDSWVPGRVEEPDTAHTAKGTKTYPLQQGQVNSLMKYVGTKRSAKYSLYKFNCTDFAVQAVAASGHSAPSSSIWGICLPNALYKDILEMKRGGDTSATTTPLKTGETEPAP